MNRKPKAILVLNKLFEVTGIIKIEKAVWEQTKEDFEGEIKNLRLFCKQWDETES